jgi:hypothetical protein
MEFEHIKKLNMMEFILDPSKNPLEVQDVLKEDFKSYCNYIGPKNLELAAGQSYSTTISHRWIFKAHQGLEFSLKYHLEGTGGLLIPQGSKTFEDQKCRGELSFKDKHLLHYRELRVYLGSLGFKEAR